MNEIQKVSSKSQSLLIGRKPSELRIFPPIAVLTAPDLDLMSFFNAVFDRFHEVAEGVAVYASSANKALDISGNLFKAERLGKAVEGLESWEREVLMQVGEIELIDVAVPERRSSGAFGHSYYYSNTWVSSDIISFMSGPLWKSGN